MKGQPFGGRRAAPGELAGDSGQSPRRKAEGLLFARDGPRREPEKVSGRLANGEAPREQRNQIFPAVGHEKRFRGEPGIEERGRLCRALNEDARAREPEPPREAEVRERRDLRAEPGARRGADDARLPIAFVRIEDAAGRRRPPLPDLPGELARVEEIEGRLVATRRPRGRRPDARF